VNMNKTQTDIQFPFKIGMPNFWSIDLANVDDSWFAPSTTYKGCCLIMYHALKTWNLLDKNVKLVMVNDYPLNPPSQVAKNMYDSILRAPFSPYPIDYLNDPKRLKYYRYNFPNLYIGVNTLSHAVPENKSISREYIDYVIDKMNKLSGRDLRYKPEKPVVTFTIRTKNRRFLNLDEMVAVAKDLGATTRVIEFAANQSFADQIQLLQNTSVMVSAHGQQLTYMMFLNQNMSVFEFFYQWGSIFQETYRYLAKALNLNYFRPLVNNGTFAITLREWCPNDSNETIAFCLQHPSHQCNKNCNDYWSKSGDLYVDIIQFRALLQRAIQHESPKCSWNSYVRPSNNLTFSALECV